MAWYRKSARWWGRENLEQLFLMKQKFVFNETFGSNTTIVMLRWHSKEFYGYIIQRCESKCQNRTFPERFSVGKKENVLLAQFVIWEIVKVIPSLSTMPTHRWKIVYFYLSTLNLQKTLIDRKFPNYFSKTIRF